MPSCLARDLTAPFWPQALHKINNQSRCFIRCIRIVSLLENFRLRVRSTDRIYPQRYLLSMSIDSIETFATYFKFRDRRGVIRATGW